MTFRRLWTFLAIALPVLAALVATLSSVDLAYHLRAGAMTIDTGTIPTSDSFTFTAAGKPWQNQQWAAQVILAAAYRSAGWTGLVLLRALLVGLLFGLVVATARVQGLGRRNAALLTLGVFVVTAVTLGLRPQLFGMVLFALTLFLIAQRRAHPRSLWLVVPAVLLWANLHGSFFLGPVVLGLAWLADLHDRAPARTTFAVAIAASVAACITPFGAAVWGYAAGVSTNALITDRITEWAPTSLRTVPGILFFGSAILVGVLLARRGRRATWPSLLWLGTFFAIGLYAVRGVAWWPFAAAFAVAPLLAEESQHLSLERSEPARRLNLVIATVLVLAAVALLPFWRPLDVGLGAPAGVVGNAPSALTAALRSVVRPGDRLFNPQPWGSWFEFAVPSATVAIDSRIEVFPPAVWDDYEAIAGGTGDWQRSLTAMGATIVVAAADDVGLVRRLTADGWVRAYSGGDGSILVRADRG
jgi:hypothetical protein